MLLLLAGCRQEYPGIPILDILEWNCHRCKKREREGKGKMLGLLFRGSRGSQKILMVTVKLEGLEKFIKLLLNLINLMVPGPILAVYCMRLSHTITCPFSKYFQVLYIFAQIFKYFSFFLKNHNSCPYFLEQALSVFIRG